VLRTPEQAGSGALADLLDRVERQLSMASEDARTARMTLDELFLALQACRLGRTEPEWQRLVEQCRRHRVLSILHQDPFTKRAFEKPRGYAGDACMMDMIYAIEDRRPAPPATVTGRAVFDYVTRVPACEGVRSRRAIVAAFIDRLAGERARPHVLSIAAGHLREANLSVAIRRGRVGRVLALDSDAESLAEVRACYGQLGVETRAASFRTLIDQRRNAERFDLVYSTGLFDYVGPRTGRKLVTAMHRMLTPSGSLLVANFLPGVRDTGYMEAFMDWKLIYRSRQDLVDLTRDIPESEIKSLELWSEEALNVIFLKVTRH
jgi:SAM-dependent methyltransferase